MISTCRFADKPTSRLGEGIESFLFDEFNGTLTPYTASAGGVGAVKVLVAKSDVDQARTIVENLAETAQRDDRNRTEPSDGE